MHPNNRKLSRPQAQPISDSRATLSFLATVMLPQYMACRHLAGAALDDQEAVLADSSSLLRVRQGGASISALEVHIMAMMIVTSLSHYSWLRLSAGLANVRSVRRPSKGELSAFASFFKPPLTLLMA
jgi:hypothetical protein